jgi:hypothetical protein
MAGGRIEHHPVELVTIEIDSEHLAPTCDYIPDRRLHNSVCRGILRPESCRIRHRLIGSRKRTPALKGSF